MSIMRIGGIASGMDTDSIVRDLMRVERMRVDKLYQQRQVLDWQKEQFREITNKVRSFRDTFFDTLRPESNLMSPAALNKVQSESSNPEIVTVTGSPSAALGESTFKVIQSATRTRVVSDDNVTDGQTLKLTDTMQQINGKLSCEDGFEFDESGKFTLTINNKEIVISKNDTLQKVLRDINNSGAGVQISYSSFSDRFTISNRETGEGSIETNDNGNFFTALQMEVKNEVIQTGGDHDIEGRNAKFFINDFYGERSSNTFTIDGLTYNIQGKIDPPEPENGEVQSPPDSSSLDPILINTSLDVESIYSVIEDFVESYNQLIDEIHGKLGEERFRDFKPLTDEQKEAMSDREIEMWEEKAQSGLLRREPALENIMRNLRTALYEPVGSFHLSEIGIETSRNYLDNGKLVLKNGGQDLKAAIASNPDKVADIFTRRSEISYSANLTAEDREERYSESGVAHRLSDILNDNIRTTRDSSGRKGILLEKAGIEGDISQYQNYYDRTILGVNQQIDRVNEMLQRKEDQYYRQFTAMEKALQQLYAQGDWLMMQMAQFNQ